MGVEVLARLIPGLVVIVGGLLALRWYVGRGAGGAGQGLRVVGRVGLARNAVVAVVETGGRRFLVGAGEHGVALLGELDGAEQPAAVAQPAIVLAAEAAPPVAVRPPDSAPLPSLPSASPAALTPPAAPPTGPRTGPLDRLRAMTVRTAPQRPFRAPST